MDQAEYFANGILVSNSYDELRYVLMSWDIGSELTLEKKRSQFTMEVLEEEIDEAYAMEDELNEYLI